MASTQFEEVRFIRPRGLAELRGVSVATVYRWVGAGLIPPPVRVSHKVAGWRVSDLRAALDRLDGRSEVA